MVIEKDEVKENSIDARWPIPRMVCSTRKREHKEEICQRTYEIHAAGTGEKNQRQNKAPGENKKKNKKVTVGQKSTTKSRIHIKPRQYEIFSDYDNNSLPRPYRVDVQKVSIRSFFFGTYFLVAFASLFSWRYLVTPFYVSLHSIDSFVSVSNARYLASPSSFHMSLKH